MLLLAGGSVLVAGGSVAGASKAPGADYELIQLCGEFDQLQRSKVDMFAGGAAPIYDDDERAIAAEPLEERQQELLETILSLRATTLTGITARAKMVWLWAEWMTPPSLEDNWDDAMVKALVRDIVGEA